MRRHDFWTRILPDDPRLLSMVYDDWKMAPLGDQISIISFDAGIQILAGHLVAPSTVDVIWRRFSEYIPDQPGFTDIGTMSVEDIFAYAKMLST